MRHLYSIDFESWVSAARVRSRFPTSNERKAKDAEGILKQGRSVLALLKQHDTKLTFFICSEIFDWWPDLPRLIRSEGHEIGWHGHSHTALTDPENLRRELENNCHRYCDRADSNRYNKRSVNLD